MTIIFTYPYELNRHTDRASHLRPLYMYQAMKDTVGSELVPALGKNRFNNINIEDASALYFESINRPLLVQRLLEKKIDIFSDYRHLKKLKKTGSRLAMYYRDGFWAGELYHAHMPSIAPEFIRLLYKKDWEFIKNTFDVIYLPSLELGLYMGESYVDNFKVLLPGCLPKTDLLEKKYYDIRRNKLLKLLYVGGISPPLNDLSLVLDIFGNKPGIELLLLLRKSEVKKYIKYYNNFSYSNVRLELDKTGNELNEYYAESDASLLVYPKHNYRDIAMPYKAFESFGCGLPVIASDNTVFSAFVSKHNIGITGDYDSLTGLAEKPVWTLRKLNDLSVNVSNYALNNTWEHRAKQVLMDLDYN